MEIIIVTVLVLFVFPHAANAYLDPGTGSYMIQIVIASAAAGVYFFKDKITSLITIIKKAVRRLKKDEHGEQ